MREYEEGYPVDANDRYYQGDYPDPERENSSNFGFANVKRNAAPGGNKAREDATDYLNERLKDLNERLKDLNERLKVLPYESTEVLFDQRVEINAESGNILQYELPISVGDSVKVTWNGAEYECTAGLAEGSGGTIFFGNPGFVGGTPNDVPFGFAIGTFDGNAMLMIIAPDYGGQSVSIKIESNVIHTIDPKFLPGGGGGGVAIVKDSAMASGVAVVGQDAPTATMNAAQIAEAVLSGKTVYFDLGNTFMPFVCGYRFAELASGVMTAVSDPDPYALFGYADEYGWYYGVKVFLDGAYNTFDYGIITE